MAGNANSGRKRNTFVTEALIIEMKAREADGDKRGMRAVAVKIWDEAEKGERWAAEFLRDTIDGKPPQAIVGDSEYDPINVKLDAERFTRAIAGLATRSGTGQSPVEPVTGDEG